MIFFRSWQILILVFTLVLFAMVPPVLSEPKRQEYEVKSVFTLKMLPYISWNSSRKSSGEKILGIYEGDSYFEIIQELLRNNASVFPIRLKKITRLDQIASCDILIIGKMDPDKLKEVFDAVQGSPVLTIGEQGEFLPEGGIVNFILENKRVRFQINIHAAEESGIKISSKLLKLAQTIRKN